MTEDTENVTLSRTWWPCRGSSRRTSGSQSSYKSVSSSRKNDGTCNSKSARTCTVAGSKRFCHCCCCSSTRFCDWRYEIINLSPGFNTLIIDSRQSCLLHARHQWCKRTLSLKPSGDPVGRPSSRFFLSCIDADWNSWKQVTTTFTADRHQSEVVNDNFPKLNQRPWLVDKVAVRFY